MLLSSIFLTLLVHSHPNFVCTHSSVQHQGQLNFFLYTYHGAPGASGSVPGTLTIQSPNGQRSVFPFTSFASLPGWGMADRSDVDAFKEASRNARIVSDGSQETLESRYGNFDGYRCYGGNANVGTVLSGDAIPNARLGTGWAGSSGNVRTIYIATLTQASSGEYLFWTDNTDYNLDSTCSGRVGACIKGESDASRLTIDVVSAGLPCSAADFPQSSDFSAPSSLLAANQPGTIVEPICIASKPYTSGGVTCLPDGTWENTFECAAQPGCKNGDVRLVTESDVTGVQAGAASCNGFNVPMGATCQVTCGNGKYARAGYQARCDGHNTWTVVGAEQCIDISSSGGPEKPVITSVDYDMARRIVTVNFDFMNNPNDAMVHNWIVTSNSNLNPTNKLNSVVVENSLELSIPDDGVDYESEDICFTISVENVVAQSSSDEFCSTQASTLAPSSSLPTRMPSASPSSTLPSSSPSEDPCNYITCAPLSQCHVAGTCTNGVCSNPFKPAGHSCEDGNDVTFNDQCDGSGTCMGSTQVSLACEPSRYNQYNLERRDRRTCASSLGISSPCSESSPCSSADCAYHCDNEADCDFYSFDVQGGCSLFRSCGTSESTAQNSIVCIKKTPDNTCGGDYKKYCNSYEDLMNAFCGGMECISRQHAKKCKKHYRLSGAREINSGVRAAPDCMSFPIDQICTANTPFPAALQYCNSYRDLMDAFCGGNECTTDRQAIRCIDHYYNYGRGEQARGGRPHANCGRNLPTDVCSGNALAYCNFYNDIKLALCNGHCTSVHEIHCKNHYWNNGRFEIAGLRGHNRRHEPCV